MLNEIKRSNTTVVSKKGRPRTFWGLAIISIVIGVTYFSLTISHIKTKRETIDRFMTAAITGDGSILAMSTIDNVGYKYAINELFPAAALASPLVDFDGQERLIQVVKNSYYTDEYDYPGSIIQLMRIDQKRREYRNAVIKCNPSFKVIGVHIEGSQVIIKVTKERDVVARYAIEWTLGKNPEPSVLGADTTAGGMKRGLTCPVEKV